MIFKKSYSFLVIPHDSGHGRSTFIHLKLLNIMFCCLILGILISGFFIAKHYIYHHQLKTAFEPTFKENERLNVERRNYDHVKDSLSTYISSLQNQVKRERNNYLSSVNNLAREVNNLRKMAVKVKIQAGFKTASLVEDGEAAGGPEEPIMIGRHDPDQPIEISRVESIIRTDISSQLSELTRVGNYLETKENLLSATPELAPLFGRMTSGFGVRRWRKSGHVGDHFGIDIAVPRGTPVYAPAEGVITTRSWVGDYGNMIELDHGNGYTTRFGHLLKFNVEIGDKVAKGQVIGYVGSTGRSTGPHLHYEVRMNGTPIDPIDYMGNLEQQ